MAAIYLDFETNKAGDFYMAGYAAWDEFHQVVLSPTLAGLAAAKSLDIETPSKFSEKLIQQAADTTLPLAAYSTAEQNILRKLFPNPPIEWKQVEYLNLRKAAAAWVRRHKKDEFDALPPLVKGASDFSKRSHPKSLASICRLIEFPTPKDYAIGKTSSRFNTVIDALKKRDDDYGRLTGVQKAKATRALKHNRYDVTAIQQLHIQIKQDSPELLKRATNPLFEEYK